MSQHAFDIAVMVTMSVTIFLTNWGVRARNGYTLSAAADFALALMGFDLAAAIASNSFENMFHNAILNANRVAVFVCLSLVALACWAGALLKIEYAIARQFDPWQETYRSGAATTWAIGAQTLAGFLLCLHFGMFWVS
jgi:hypothetical protein